MGKLSKNVEPNSKGFKGFQNPGALRLSVTSNNVKSRGCKLNIYG